MKIALKKDGSSLKAADEEAENAFRRIKQGEVVLMDFTKHRNVDHHRKLFALLKIAADNSGRYNGNVIAVLDDIKAHTGRCDAKLVPAHHSKWAALLRRLKSVLDGNGLPMPSYFIVIKPHSIAFESMDQAEFEPFYEEAVQFVLSEVMPDVDREDLEFEVAARF